MSSTIKSGLIKREKNRISQQDMRMTITSEMTLSFHLMNWKELHTWQLLLSTLLTEAIHYRA